MLCLNDCEFQTIKFLIITKISTVLNTDFICPITFSVMTFDLVENVTMKLVVKVLSHNLVELF